MPELPEVAALAAALQRRADGCQVTALDVASVHMLKTFSPGPHELPGRHVTGVGRVGKFLDLDLEGVHLVIHLARAGWLRWRENLPTTPAKPGRGPLTLRLHLVTAAGEPCGFDVTEQGTQKSSAAWLVHEVAQVPRIATLGIDPMAPGFDNSTFSRLLAEHPRQQIKSVLRSQSILAGIGNAYSDEILHAARMSPFKTAGSLDVSAQQLLYDSLRAVLATAVERAAGLEMSDLKDSKRSAMAVHGRTGQVCLVCGDVVREVAFADSSLQYCATCQTGGKPLADRRMSKLLR